MTPNLTSNSFVTNVTNLSNKNTTCISLNADANMQRTR